MKNKFYLAVIFLPLISYAAYLPVPNNLVALNSEEGIKNFSESQNKKDYWPLSAYFETQKTLTFCGVTSAVMVLNALNINPPSITQYAPYQIFTQENFFTSQVSLIVSEEDVKQKGMSLDLLTRAINTFSGVHAIAYHTKAFTKEACKSKIIAALKNKNSFVIVNYIRKYLGEEEGPHFSPIAAYDEATDRFLIMDVSRYKYPPVWVKSVDLWNAMNTYYEGRNLGFIIVQKVS
jgi:hypothetical protein